MKRVTWKLMKYIEDPETGSRVSLDGVTLTGTPLQVAVLFECLSNSQGKVDLSMPDRDIWNIGKDALKNARDSKEWVECYEDPDLPKDQEDISKWLSSVSKWKVEIIE